MVRHITHRRRNDGCGDQHVPIHIRHGTSSSFHQCADVSRCTQHHRSELDSFPTLNHTYMSARSIHEPNRQPIPTDVLLHEHDTHRSVNERASNAIVTCTRQSQMHTVFNISSNYFPCSDCARELRRSRARDRSPSNSSERCMQLNSNSRSNIKFARKILILISQIYGVRFISARASYAS